MLREPFDLQLGLYLPCYRFLLVDEDEDTLPSYIEAIAIREELFLDLRKQ